MKYSSSIKSIAIDLPKNYFTNDMPPFSTIPNMPKNWWRLWGVEGRYMIDKSQGETCSTLARNASLKAINKAGLEVRDIDLIIASSCTITNWSDINPATIFPGLSAYLKKELGCNKSTMNLEVNQSCISFLVSLQVASDYVEQGMYKNVLVCSAETFTEIGDFSTLSSSIFGDAASAIVIGRSESNGKLLSSYYKSIPANNEIATLQWRPPFNDQNKSKTRAYFTLDENAPTIMQQFVPHNVPNVVFKALEKSNCKVDNINHFVFHQPSSLLIKMWAMGIGIKKDRYTTTIEEYGCLSSASIPVTLYKALKENKIKENSNIVLAGASIGWGFGAQVWKLENINF